MDGLQPCNHEEADSRIFLHVHDAALQHHHVLIRSVDTDVFILAVAQMQRIPDKELWLAFGTGKQFRQHILHAAYQGGHVWSQVHMALPQLPSPSEWGWKKDKLWRPVWTTLPQAQQR
ncbi:Hypothetical predicted protein [Paramuricea clavata]|uniref:Uncharacterized protein n=1 Tax=Paramuricea clavata TaxID=317549 RepID=A0A6S7FJ47_PARCT|nr:Hypothetical predicted protein [Paramuricea clavata]